MSTDIRFGTDGWRAVIGADFTYESLRRVADAAARVFSADNPGGTILVGYDTRFEAGSFAAAAAEVMAAHGLTVKVSDRYLPTPALCFSVARDDAAVGGVMLTASHNPSEYLGFKLRMSRRRRFAGRVHRPRRGPAACRAARRARRVRARRPRRPVPREPAGHGRCRGDPRGEPARGRRPALRRGPDLPRRDASRLGVDVLEVHGERNPGFGGLHPEPIPPWIDSTAELVKAEARDAAFVTDGDADRIGAIDRHGNFVSPHRIIGLVAAHLVQDKGLTGRVVKTLSTSVLVDRYAATLGLEVTTTPIGFKWIYNEMVKGDVLLGGEESGGIGIPSHVRERDGLLMALMLTEMMAQRGKGLGELVDDMLAITGPMEYSRVDLKLAPAVKDAFLARAPGSGAGRDRRRAGARHRPRRRREVPARRRRVAAAAPVRHRAAGARLRRGAHSAGVVDDLLAAGRALVEG